MIAAVDQKNVNGPVRYVRFLEVPISPQIRYKPLHLFDRMTLEQWEWHAGTRGKEPPATILSRKYAASHVDVMDLATRVC
jgi:hypothetical protein